MKSVLVLDDVKLVAESIKDYILQQYPGVSVVTCFSVKETLDRLRQEKFDLLILDYHLLNGLALEILESFPEDYYILMSGKYVSDSEIEFLQNKFTRLIFLNKPFEPKDLLNAINKLKGG